MTTKQCFKCKEILPLDKFYKHPAMADGRVNKCKECNKKDVRDNRAIKIDYYREYDRKRGSRQSLEDLRLYRKNNPIKYKAHTIVNHAINAKFIIKQPCEICGCTTRLHAHHDDYSKPLDIRWLCAEHHFQWHKENGKGLNGD